MQLLLSRLVATQPPALGVSFVLLSLLSHLVSMQPLLNHSVAYCESFGHHPSFLSHSCFTTSFQ